MENFCGLSGEVPEYDTARAVILPVSYNENLYDGPPTYKRTEDWPSAVIKASSHLELYDEELNKEPFRANLYTAQSIKCKDNAQENAKEIEIFAQRYVKDGKFIVMLGENNSITIGLVMALKKRYNDFCVLQIDAQANLKDEHKGDRYNSQCIMRRISELRIPLIQVGIRSISKEEINDMKTINTNMFYMHKIINYEDWMDRVLECTNKNVLITIDLDAFGTSVIPSPNAVEPGGFDWWTLLKLLRYVFKAKNVISVDVIGLSPIESEQSSSYIAAKLVYKLIGYKFENEI